MNTKNILEYVIIGIAVLLLFVFLSNFWLYHYAEDEVTVGSISLLSPIESQYTVVGDTIEFKNSAYAFYDLNITKTNSSDDKVQILLSEFDNFKTGSVDYYNDTCYLVGVPYDDGVFTDHFMIVPIDAFDKDTLSFTRNTDIWLFDGKDMGFVRDSALNSVVEL